MSATTNIWMTVSGGHQVYGYPQEIGWTLSCCPSLPPAEATNNNMNCSTISGGAAFYGYFEMTHYGFSVCTLDMTDSYGDGWNGFAFSSFGGQTFALHSGSFGRVTFYSVQPPSPPPAPPSPPPIPPLQPPLQPPPSPTMPSPSVAFGALLDWAASAAIVISLIGARAALIRRRRHHVHRGSHSNSEVLSSTSVSV